MQTTTQQCHDLANRVSMKLGTAVTFGYIGNLDHRSGDHRSWRFFTKIPVHNPLWEGSTHSFGGHSTDKLEELLSKAEYSLFDSVKRWLDAV